MSRPRRYRETQSHFGPVGVPPPLRGHLCQADLLSAFTRLFIWRRKSRVSESVCDGEIPLRLRAFECLLIRKLPDGRTGKKMPSYRASNARIGPRKLFSLDLP